MGAIREAYLEHERFMRPDAHRFFRPDAERWMTAEERRLLAPLDLQCPGSDAIERKLDLDGIAEAVAIKAERNELLRLKRVLADLKFDLALLRFARKYRPDQLRDDHGRFANEGGGVGRVTLAAADRPKLGPEAIAAILAESAKRAIEAYRKNNSLLDLFGGRVGTVAYTDFNGEQIFGLNSTAPSYTSRDRAAAMELRNALIQKYPEVMDADDVGRRPNDAVFHAETNLLVRAARTNGGTLKGQSLEVHADRELCRSCESVLPYVGLELGNPTVTFVGPKGRRKTMRDGSWIE
jgi:hypothetical protein